MRNDTADSIVSGGLEVARLEALNEYLVQSKVVAPGPIELRRISGGQSNPTFKLHTNDRTLVLRKQPDGKLAPKAHELDREFTVLSALSKTDFPVPRAIHYCNDRSIIGTTFYVMAHVEGHVWHDPLMPGSEAAIRASAWKGLARTMAHLHSISPASVGLERFGRHEGFLERQIVVWGQSFRATRMREFTNHLDRIEEWLLRHLPASSPTGIVHGDFRLGNIVVSAEGRPLAVLDWELTTLGDPYTDLAYCCLPYHLPPNVLGGFLGTRFAHCGIPDEAAFREVYFTARRAAPPTDWNFYIVFSLFRLSAILQGVLFRSLQGNAAGDDAREKGAVAKICSDRAQELISI